MFKHLLTKHNRTQIHFASDLFVSSQSFFFVLTPPSHEWCHVHVTLTSPFFNNLKLNSDFHQETASISKWIKHNLIDHIKRREYDFLCFQMSLNWPFKTIITSREWPVVVGGACEVSGQWGWFISLRLWLARRYKALCWVTYGCNLALITYTITLPLIRLSLRRGEGCRQYSMLMINLLIFRNQAAKKQRSCQKLVI